MACFYTIHCILGIVANVVVIMIAFVASLHFVNATFGWFGDRVGIVPPEYERLSFQVWYFPKFNIHINFST